VDLSALIFVALAVAWAVYLVPKALKAHEVDSVTRPVDRFSDRLRVLARREPVPAVAEVEEGRPSTEVEQGRLAARHETETTPEVEEGRSSAEVEEGRLAARHETAAPRRTAAKRAARRRRRVLGLLLLANAAVAGVAVAGVIVWPYVAIPATLLVAWLVACRLMVRHERAARAAQRVRKPRRTLADEVLAEEAAAEADGPQTADVPAVSAELDDTDGWDPVPITLPTYVAKEPAGRSVRTIDLDSTGVWSSGRNEADSQLAREAESAKAAEQADDAAAAERRRAAGS
jgi:hypothetical protein